jgi:mRNA interferase MazF
MARILRGDVYWAEFSPTIGHEQAGERPVIILSHDIFNERSGIVIAIAVSSQEPRAAFPLTHEITTAKLPKRSWARISQIRTLSIQRLGKKLGHLAPEEIDLIVEGLNEIIAG